MSPSVPLYAYQQQGVSWLALRDTGILGYEPGLGKTLTSIAALDTLHLKRVLVLCQAVGKAHWQREFQRWQQVHRSVAVIHGVAQALPPQADVVIANYDLVSRDSKARHGMLTRTWDALILDEGHALKSRTSKRTRAVYGKRGDRTDGIAARARHVWVLTGTPAPNHAGELYPHLRALYPDAIRTSHGGPPMSEPQFVEAFCTWRDTPFGRQITGSRNIADLRHRLEPFLLRARKADVLQDLPPLSFDTRVVHPRDVPMNETLLQELARAEMQVAEDLAGASVVLDHGSTSVSDDDLLDALRFFGAHAHIATQRRLAGLVKAEIAVHLIVNELLTRGRKLIVFAHHQGVIDRVTSGLRAQEIPTVKLDGRDPPGVRERAIHDFQNDPGVRVFVGQIQAAGTSITLTAASDVLFVEASWVPSENVQAASRAHRIGQRDGVLARFLVLDGSLDRRIMHAVARKTRELAQLIDHQPTQQEFPACPSN